MSIYRGAGGSGDAVNDSSSEASLVQQLAIEAQSSATAADSSATAAASSASSASTSATNAAASAATIDTTLFARKANNLSDLTSASTARTNLGLGTAATTASTDYATAAQGTTADTAYADRLKWDGGATGLVAATGRTSLGLVASATTDTTNASNISSGTLPSARLPTSGVTANTYGSSTSIPVITVDSTGRATTITTATVASSGKLLQVVQTLLTTSFTTSSNSMTDVTGMSVTITPTSSSSKILLITSMSASKSSSSYGMAFQWVRNGTAVGIGTLGTTAPNYSFGYTQMGSNSINNVNFSYLDSPATTSAVTYKLQVRIENTGGTFALNNNPTYLNGGTDVYHGGYTSTITVMEIAA